MHPEKLSQITDLLIFLEIIAWALDLDELTASRIRIPHQ